MKISKSMVKKLTIGAVIGATARVLVEIKKAKRA